jgi:uncharacterized protein (UPF0276 family)
MPANPFNAFTEYGIGIGLRVPHYRHILAKKPVVDWFEIISENFMVDGDRPLEVLDAILEQYRVVQHGVAMYFGSADKFDREHLKRLKRLVRRTNTPWLSDHLCWGSVDGRYTHDLLPMPYTFAVARHTAEKIRGARDHLEVPICVENVSSYAEYHASEMTEWEFLSEVVEPQQHPASSRWSDPYRRSFEVRKIHPRHARSSRAGSGLENVWACTAPGWQHCHSSRMGRSDPIFS